MTDTLQNGLSDAGDTALPDDEPGRSWLRYAGTVAVVLALAVGSASYLILTGLTPVDPTENVVTITLLINLAIVGGLVLLIALESVKLLVARQKKRAAARLHVRIIGLFCVIAAVPALLLTAIASLTLDRGLDRWFEQRTRSIIEDSLTVARAYITEHNRGIRDDLLLMASDLNRGQPLFKQDRERFLEFFSTLAVVRGLPGAYIIRANRSVILTARTPRPIRYIRPGEDLITQANDGDSVVFGSAGTGTAAVVYALVKLSEFDDAYLYVIRPVDPRVVRYLQEAEDGVAEYRSLEVRRFGVQLTFALIFLGLSLIILLSAIWLGIGFTNRLVAPIRRLIGAADRVSSGDLSVKLPVSPSEGDLAHLTSTFNNMTGQLETQRDELLQANKMVDSRRRFTEAVLSGVTVGVVGVDEKGNITLVNRSALTILGISQPSIMGMPFAEQIPEAAPLMERARIAGGRLVQGEVIIDRDGKSRNLTVRVTTEQSSAPYRNYVVTLDDVTELVTAQRSAAWADVARRIAHEIKNPLTPIQLSAERLRRKYGRNLTDDREVFDQCTETIIRQVGDIGRMVDEFSSFARMPKPVFEKSDLVELARESVFLMRVSHPEVTIDLKEPAKPVWARCDRRLMTQALTNLIKNAAEAIETRKASHPEESEPGHIDVTIKQAGKRLRVDIVDNGIGLPAEDRAKLLEPYVTSREKGTGLGLAIVKKIVEEHGGAVQLHDAPAVAQGGTGALVRLIMPPYPEEPARKSASEETPEKTEGEAGAGSASAEDGTAKERETEDHVS